MIIMSELVKKLINNSRTAQSQNHYQTKYNELYLRYDK